MKPPSPSLTSWEKMLLCFSKTQKESLRGQWTWQAWWFHGPPAVLKSMCEHSCSCSLRTNSTSNASQTGKTVHTSSVFQVCICEKVLYTNFSLIVLSAGAITPENGNKYVKGNLTLQKPPLKLSECHNQYKEFVLITYCSVIPVGGKDKGFHQEKCGRKPEM